MYGSIRGTSGTSYPGQNVHPPWDSNPEPSAILLSYGMTIPKADALSIEPAGLDENRAKNSVVHSVGTMSEYILHKIVKLKNIEEKLRFEMRTRFTASQLVICD